MKKILAFAGSTSKTSMNKQLVTYSSSLMNDTEVEVLDMNDYTTLLYSVDEEKNGFPDKMKQLSEMFLACDGFIISLAEHNGSYAAAYKNTIDWLSRIERELFNNKPMLLMAASPGGRGGASVLGAAEAYYPRLGAEIVEVFSFPNFYQNFSDGKITNLELDNLLKDKLEVFNLKLNS